MESREEAPTTINIIAGEIVRSTILDIATMIRKYQNCQIDIRLRNCSQMVRTLHKVSTTSQSGTRLIVYYVVPTRMFLCPHCAGGEVPATCADHAPIQLQNTERSERLRDACYDTMCRYETHFGRSVTGTDWAPQLRNCE